MKDRSSRNSSAIMKTWSGILCGLCILLFKPTYAASKSTSSGDRFFYKKTFDLGLSSGAINDKSYTEIDLGLNLYFNPNFDFRNAIFSRFGSGVESIVGLDSSARGIYFAEVDGFGFTSFLGPGVRIPSKGNVTPFLEAGLVLKAPGIGFGIGAKSLANSWVSSFPNDTQIFIILAGGGEL